MWLATRIRVRFSLPAVLLSLMLAGCQSLGLARYSEYMLGKIPDQYTERRNPFLEMSENILIARELYQDQCSFCHGVKGKGDGGLSSEASPHPANLTLTRRLPIATDAFFSGLYPKVGRRLARPCQVLPNLFQKKRFGKL